MKRIIPILAALALLAGCSSLTKVTRPDPENPKARPYVEIEFDGKNHIDIEQLYFWQGLRKVIVKNVLLNTVYRPSDDRKIIGSSEIKGTLLVTDELKKAYPNLIEQIEYDRKYDLWLQLKIESFVKGDKKSRVVVAYIKDIEGLRPVEEVEAERAREAAEQEAREEARKERIALARRIIVKKYPALATAFPAVSDYEAWLRRCDGGNFIRSLKNPTLGYGYRENDMFIVEKYSLEVRDMYVNADGYFTYLVEAIDIMGSQPCYLVSATRIPHTSAQSRSTIFQPLLLQYIGKDQYREGYRGSQVKTCDVFLAFAEGSKEYANYKSMRDDMQRIAQNPSEYAYILDE